VEPLSQNSREKREALRKLFAGVIGLFGSVQPFGAQKAVGAQGAFEMDMEYYLKNALNGNQGKISSSTQRTPFPTGRTLDEDTASTIVNIIEEEVIKILRGLRGQVPVDSVAVAKEQFSGVPSKVKTLLPSFKEFVPIAQDNIQDSYYLDIYLLCLYREIANLLTLSQQRVLFRRRVGEAFLNWIVSQDKSKGLQKLTIPSTESSNGSSASMDSLSRGIGLLLDSFVRLKLIKSYEFDIEDFADKESATFSFAENLPVSFQFTLQAPINIISFIEQYKLDTFFHPDLLATTVSAYCRLYGFGVRFDDYLLDNFYRESNFDVVGQDVLVEMAIIPTALANNDKDTFIM